MSVASFMFKRVKHIRQINHQAYLRVSISEQKYISSMIIMKRPMLFIAALAIFACGSCQPKNKYDQSEAVSTDSIAAYESQTTVKEVDNNLPIVYDFSAVWCGPCKLFAPVFEKVSKEYADKANFVKVDVDTNPELAKQWNIRSVPTIIVAHPSTRQYAMAQGAMSEEDFKAFLDQALKP